MLRAIIIDDEEAGVETLKVLASRNKELIKVVGHTMQPEKGIALIEDYHPDVVFLDISMPTMNGFEMLSRLSFQDFILVFTTAHKEFAIEAIKNRAFDYLLKPINNESFNKCLERVHHELTKIKYGDRGLKENKLKEQLPLIEIQVKDGIQFIKQTDIIRLEASRSYTEFYLENGIRHVASKSLIEFESKLDKHLFYRCHKSHIINLQKVQKFINHNGFFALMSDGSRPDISKSNKDVFLERLKGI